MNDDAVYASQFKMVYDAYSGIKLKVLDNKIWKESGKIKDAGPLNWKYSAAELSSSDSNIIHVRMEFIPDNFMIDYIAVDTTYLDENMVSIQEITPSEITDGCGDNVDSIINFIGKDDSGYLITEPGDNYSFTYIIPSKKSCEQTLLISSKGYYNEWIRGSWITKKDDRYSFDLYDINGTLSHLADDWIENSELLESEFFHSKFNLKVKK